MDPAESLTSAEFLLTAALARNRLHPEANLFAALCASRRGDALGAVELLRRAHTAAPHNAEIVRDYGAALFRANRTREAAPLLRRAVELLGGLVELGEGSRQTRASLASAQAPYHIRHLTILGTRVPRIRTGGAHTQAIREPRVGGGESGRRIGLAAHTCWGGARGTGEAAAARGVSWRRVGGDAGVDAVVDAGVGASLDARVD